LRSVGCRIAVPVQADFGLSVVGFGLGFVVVVSVGLRF